MVDAAHRQLDAGAQLGAVGIFIELGLQPALMAQDEFIDVAHGAAGRHGDAQPSSTRVNPQRQPLGAAVLDDPQWQGAASNLMRPLDAERRGFFEGGAQEAENHGRAFM